MTRSFALAKDAEYKASQQISTGKLCITAVHSRPINVVVYDMFLGNLRSREILSQG